MLNKGFILLSLLFLISCGTENETSDVVQLSSNGVTILCPDGEVGDTGVVDGVEY